MQIETLESRQLMSVTLNASTGVLGVYGTDGADVISVKMASNKVVVMVGNAGQAFDPVAVKSIQVFAKAGADKVTVDANVFKNVFVDAGNGSPGGEAGDFVQGGSGNDTLKLHGLGSTAKGGAGNDELYTDSGYCDLYGDAGNDLFISGRATTGENGFHGGTGTDTISYSSSSAGLVIQNGQVGTYANTANNGWAFTGGGGQDGVDGMENFTGTSYADRIYGTDGKNTIKGSLSNDYIEGRGGDDKLYGGYGDDALFGGSGNDYIEGNAGKDFLSGEAGEDAMFGNDGDDTFYSKDGTKDFVSGGAGYDKVTKDAADVLDSIEKKM